MPGFSLSPHCCTFGPALTPIFGTPAADVIAATAEYQAIFGRAGGDVLSSQFNNTALFGGAGHDRIEICLDLADEVPVSLYEVTACADGGLGEDRITVDATLFSFDSPVAMSVHVNGGAGADVIDVSTVSNGLLDSIVVNTIQGGSGDDVISAGAVGGDFFGNESTAINEIWGGSGDDHVIASATVFSNMSLLASNYLDGGSGNDVLWASTYVDSNSAAPEGRNTLLGGAGDDTLVADNASSSDPENYFSTLTTYLSGGAGHDSLTATMLALAEDTATGTNTLEGGSGNDMLSGNVVAGSAFAVRATANNALSGGAGNDVLTAFADSNYFGDPFFTGSAHNLLDGGSGNDVLTATVASGSSGLSELYGGAGNDVLAAIGGMDNLLDGGVGRDTLTGSDGTDLIRGGTGGDCLTGGAGADQFIFATGDGSDRVCDFEDGLDLIRITAGAIDFSAVTVIDQGLDTLLRFANVAVLLEGVDSAIIDAGDFLFA